MTLPRPTEPAPAGPDGMRLPSVSVIVPNYNHARLLPRCLDALLNQSITPSEVLVIDDGSTDNSLEVLSAYERKWPQLKVHRNPKNLGVVPTLNRGLSLATSEYVSFPAADDEVLPGLFEKLLPMVARYPAAGAASGLTEWRAADKGLSWRVGTGMPRESCYLSPEAMVRLAREGRFSFSGQHALYRRDALIKAGGWREELRWFTDCFGAWVVGFRHGICHVPEVLSVFHLDPGSYYSRPGQGALRRAALERLFELLESDAYSDVSPFIQRSGLLGGFGPGILRPVLRHRRRWGYVNAPFLRQVSRRTVEMLGRSLLPGWLARLCLRVFYGRS